MHEVLVNRFGDLRKSVVMLTDRPDMTLDVYRGRKTTTQQRQLKVSSARSSPSSESICIIIPTLDLHLLSVIPLHLLLPFSVYILIYSKDILSLFVQFDITRCAA